MGRLDTVSKGALAGAAAFAVTAAATVAVASAASPRAQLRDFACHPAYDPSGRSVSVTAVMRPLPSTQRMALRFELLKKSNGQVSEVKGGDLGRWIHPQNPTLGQRPGDTWIVKKPVSNLPAPATYHFRVSFRWRGSGGSTLGQAVRISASCYQPERRPDLQVAAIAIRPGESGNDQYVATIRNNGQTGAGPFDVQLSVPPSTSDNQTVQYLGSHAKVRVTFVDPACSSGSSVTVIADPDRRVDDYNRANNSLTVTCP